ncbi:O-methyltransferase [Pectinatus sottacetonis]|uniref:O-methyltransferase n=1 Tax=Pectinatus sottacetonis TaxID=1002795 RepID=UPI0018C6E95A|nr:O-methyltransferase [Pectinatus sottacetonis]
MKELLQEMQEYAIINHVPIIKKAAADILCCYIKQNQPEKILEIGTAIGYSALLMAGSSDGNSKITTLEINDARISTAHSFINRSIYRNNIEILKGDAGQLLQNLPGKFDFVFIDAAKGQYIKYLAAIMPLLADKGIIAADNVLFRGYVESKEKPPRRYKTIVKRLREYIKELDSRSEFITEIYHDGDGLAVSQKRI